MTTTLKLTDNIQSQSMLSDTVLEMKEDVPLKYKNFISTKSTQLSEGSASYQATNLNSMVEGTFYLRTQVRVRMQGTTINSALRLPNAVTNAPNTSCCGTPSTLWSGINGGFDNFCLNKAIRELKYNIGGCAWTESGTRDRDLLDILVKQFDKEKLESWGIYDQPKVDNMQLVYGTGSINEYNWQGIITYWNIGVGANLLYNTLNVNIPEANNISKQQHDNPFWKQYNSRYVKVVNCEFYSADPSTGVAPLNKAMSLDGHWVPMDAAVAPADQTYFGNGSYYGPLWQIVDFEILEPIISPYCSNPFTKNEYIKSYYAGSAVNITTDFDTDYIKNGMFKLGCLQQSAAGGQFQAVVGTTVQCNIISSSLEFNTFSSERLMQPSNKVIYYVPQRVLQPTTIIPGGNAVNAEFVNAGARKILNSSTISQSTDKLAWLPRYLLLVPKIQAVLSSNSSTTKLADIEELSLKLGPNLDLLGNMTIDEIYRHSAEVMGNSKLYENICGKKKQPFQIIDCFQDFSRSTDARAMQFSALYLNNAYKRVFSGHTSDCFIMLDLAKLNADGKLPYVNYGALINGPNNTLNVSAKLRYPEFMAAPMSSGNQINVEFDVYLFQKKIRTFDHRNSQTTEIDVSFDLTQVEDQLESYRTEEYHGCDYNEDMYVGGSWMSGLQTFYKTVKPFIPIIGKTARLGINALNKHIHTSNYGDTPKSIGRNLSKGLKMLGYGEDGSGIDSETGSFKNSIKRKKRCKYQV